MPRPRTHVSINLPPDAMKVLLERAEAHGETLEQYLERYLTKAAHAHLTRPTTSFPAAPSRNAPLTRSAPIWKKSMTADKKQ